MADRDASRCRDQYIMTETDNIIMVKTVGLSIANLTPDRQLTGYLVAERFSFTGINRFSNEEEMLDALEYIEASIEKHIDENEYEYQRVRRSWKVKHVVFNLNEDIRKQLFWQHLKT